MLIREYMTKSPLSVARDTPLAEARDILRRHDIRHLPVLDGEKLVGILSERNVMAGLASPAGEKLLVEDAMLPDVFAVDPDDELAAVAEQMAKEKYGCAVIREKDGRVAGLFTTVDACRLLAEQLKGKKSL